MHQLRAHAAALGRPIAGDKRYGGLFVLAGQPAPGLMLHAARLVCPHPSGGVLDVSAPLPPPFLAFAAALGLAEGLS